MEFALELFIVDAVDEGIVATVAHGQPIAAEPDDVDVAVLVDGGEGDLKDLVQLQRKPADAEQQHDYDEHFDHLR